jgi:NTE family protein
MKTFFEDPEDQLALEEILSQAAAIKTSGKRFSDVEDQEGNQYVDLVQEGGGVLGIALVGYTFVLEKAGIRFFSLAGTSAGAINTMMMAGLGRLQEEKSEKILEILSNKDLFELVDGDKIVREILQRALKGRPVIHLNLIFNIRRLIRTLSRKLGLNPGNNFEQWIGQELKKAGIESMADIEVLREEVPAGFRHVEGLDISKMQARLAIIAADVTTHSKIEFPRMSELFFEKPGEVTPARLVRASMAIPFFFEPVTFENIPNSGQTRDEKWTEHCKYFGPVPPTVRFVDGGLLSNFPINVFHRTDGGVPRKPTFGARLSTYRETYSKTSGVMPFCGSMVSAMRQIHDYDFLKRNPDFSRLICHIDADQEFNWLDFQIERKRQVEMFLLGARKGLKFLEEFNWKEYKEIRKKLAV